MADEAEKFSRGEEQQPGPVGPEGAAAPPDPRGEHVVLDDDQAAASEDADPELTEEEASALMDRLLRQELGLPQPEPDSTIIKKGFATDGVSYRVNENARLDPQSKTAPQSRPYAARARAATRQMLALGSPGRRALFAVLLEKVLESHSAIAVLQERREEVTTVTGWDDKGRITEFRKRTVTE